MTTAPRAAFAATTLALTLAACQTAAPPKPDPAPAAEREEAPPPAPSFQWPAPEGWRTETIPFPLDFAKEIDLQGVEELRFAPGMFKPDQPGYWSYAFVWWLDGQPALGQAELERMLLAYFRGLTTEVAKSQAAKGKPMKIDPGRIRTSLSPSSGAPAKEGHTVQAFSGTAELYDAFATGKPISLNMDVWVWDCPVAGKRAALVLASPRSATDPVWQELTRRREEFLCHKY